MSCIELARSSDEQKKDQLQRLSGFKAANVEKSEEALKKLQQAALNGNNIFEEMMNTVRHCSLGSITQALYQVGGRYRRNM